MFGFFIYAPIAVLDVTGMFCIDSSNSFLVFLYAALGFASIPFSSCPWDRHYAMVVQPGEFTGRFLDVETKRL